MAIVILTLIDQSAKFWNPQSFSGFTPDSGVFINERTDSTSSLFPLQVPKDVSTASSWL